MNEQVEKTETKLAEPREKSEFIKELEKLAKRKDRAALAHLRSGLRRKDSRSTEMYPVIGRFLSEKTNRSYENAVFIVAALFAYYPDAKTNAGNLGASLRQLKDDSDSIEKRFVALLNAEADELPDYLRQIIGLLKSKEIPVNWQQLFKDVQYWETTDETSKRESVQKRWARSFWGSYSNENNQDKQENSKGENL
ncbi:MAG: type I-E CRISPR-associated protein Cse2/CasB [Acidobacteriota bacterium]|nr:type I-E CRISPR-associated protein Cse2/CasB [Acidobacteriota bacterium]